MPQLLEIKISGLDELQEKLDTIPLRVAKRVIKTSLLDAAKIWLEEMKARVRQGPHNFKGRGAEFGVIERSITMKTRVTSDLAATVSVGVPAKVFWAKFVEFGTRARRRGSKSGGARHGGSTGAMPSFPFARPTFDAHKDDVLEKFIEGVREALAAEGFPLS